MFLGFCSDAAPIFKFIGNIVTLFKIIIPIVLIVIGVIALGKAVIAGDDKEIKTATTLLIKKLIVGICIFFIPTIVNAVFNFVGTRTTDEENDTNVCINCITNPGSCNVTPTTGSETTPIE